MQFDAARLSDPGYFRENRMDAHSDHLFTDGAGDSGRISLNGAWKFFHALNEEQIIPGFESAEYDCRPWAEIPVPAHIQMEGYGHPQYCNTQYPWDGTEELAIGQAPRRFNPVACYAKYFNLPEEWEGERVVLSFQGAESCVALWVNGRYVGYASDSFTPDEFEITSFLQPGENKIACRVYRWNVGSWLEDQDFMRFSGLFREVYLQKLPKAHLKDLRVRTMLDDAYQDAVLEAELATEAPEDTRVVMTLYRDGREITGCEYEAGTGTVSAALPVSNPDKWSAEQPNLYDLEILLCGPEGRAAERVCQKVGFRRFEMKDGLMLLNGKRIVFKGTNRHDFCGETGRAVDAATLRRDLVTMKRNNINAIRTSHYPNASLLYALCDELGVYVIDECNMETHGVWDQIARGKLQLSDSLPGDRMEYLPLLRDRIHSMVERDKNHPCVLIWSCGNESFGGTVILEMSRELRRMDDTRLVHYEGVFWDPRYPETTDMYSQMYTPEKDVRQWLREHDDKPFILCEYTHSMGNSNGAMHKYTRMAYDEPRYQGGFIWDYIDQGIRTKDRYGETFWGYGGDFDDRPNDGDFSGNGICFADGTPTPKMQEVKYNYRNIEAEVSRDSIRILNRNLFTNTSAFDCRVTLARDGREILRAELATDVPPEGEKTYPMPFDIPEEGGEYTATVVFRLKEDTAWARAGHEIAWDQGVFGKAEACPPALKPAALRIVRGDRNLGIEGEGFSALYSMERGMLISYRVCGREMLKTPPRPVFWRAPIDNDNGCRMPARYARWKAADLYAAPMGEMQLKKEKGEDPVRMNGDGSVTAATWWQMPGTPENACRMTVTFFPGGECEIGLRLEPDAAWADPPLFGVMMKMDADFDRIRYYGLGPEECYIDRQEGARLGIWETGAKENFTRYLYPQECGNRTGVRWAEVTDFRGRGLTFRGDGMEFCAIPWTAHEVENAAHANELPRIQYTVVRCALRQMGVGGDNSWGARTHEEYYLDGTKPLDFTFRFQGKI